MLKMLTHCVGPAFAMVLVTPFALAAMPQPAAADDRPPANDVGQFFGMSLSCGCLAEDEKFLTAFYYAIFAEDFDQSYADNMVGEMRYYANQEWRNQASLCSEVCQSEYMTMMGEIVDDADAAMASPVFVRYFNEAYERYFGAISASDDGGNFKNWQHCYWRPNSPVCADVDDPASPVVSRDASETLPECSVTEDMFAGGQCEGRQKGRVSGY